MAPSKDEEGWGVGSVEAGAAPAKTTPCVIVFDDANAGPPGGADAEATLADAGAAAGGDTTDGAAEKSFRAASGVRSDETLSSAVAFPPGVWSPRGGKPTVEGKPAPGAAPPASDDFGAFEAAAKDCNAAGAGAPDKEPARGSGGGRRATPLAPLPPPPDGVSPAGGGAVGLAGSDRRRDVVRLVRDGLVVTLAHPLRRPPPGSRLHDVLQRRGIWDGCRDKQLPVILPVALHLPEKHLGKQKRPRRRSTFVRAQRGGPKRRRSAVI